MASEPELPELKNSVTVGVMTVTRLDWWNGHPDAFSEAEAVLGWEELHVDRRTVAPSGRSSKTDQDNA
jgi:hypothetical protein